MLRSLSIVLLLTASCDFKSPTPAEKYDSAADQLIAEFGGVQVDRAAIDQVLEISKRLTLETRSAGILKLVTSLKDAMAARGIDASVLDEIEDFTIGQPLPGVGEYWDHQGAGAASSDVSSKSASLRQDNANVQYLKCPPIEAKGKQSCFQIVDVVKKQALATIDAKAIFQQATAMIEQDATCSKQPQEFRDAAGQYLDTLALDIHKFGIDIAAIRAEFALRDAGLCDDEVIEGPEIARLRGIDESVKVLRQVVGLKDFEIRPEGADCLVVGASGPAAEARIEQQIKTYVEEMKQGNDAFCADMSDGNPNVIKAYDLFGEGLRHGMKAHITTIWVGTFRNGVPWGTIEERVVANIDGCNAKDQIKYTTSPLVIDLDGDGLQLSTDRVGFDLRATGQPQQVTWAGKTEGILALDQNGDGRITSGRELFGDRSLCGSERCADGAAALAMYDDKARGGNGDGRIDARDRVFDALKIWVDANHDGRSQAGELQGLRAHGVRALSLEATRVNHKLAGGTVSLTLQVQTDGGARTAYDVWFDNLAAPGFASPLF